MLSLTPRDNSIFGVIKNTIQDLAYFATGVLLTVALMLAADHAVAAGSEHDLGKQIEQKIALTRNYLESSTAAEIASGENPQARRMLEKSRELLEQAVAALRDGKLQDAHDKANLSLQSFTAAGTANLKKTATSEHAAHELDSMRAEIDAYLESFAAALLEKGPSMAGLLDRQYVDELLASAGQSQSIGDYTNARAALGRARQAVVNALIKIRNNETVVYSVEFQTPADEFRYERERYAEYESLGEKLLDSGELDNSRIRMFEHLKNAGDRLNNEALELAGSGDYAAAIARMESAVGQLVKGLRLLGVPLSM